MTEKEMNILNISTGELKFPKSLPIDKGVYVNNEDKLYVFSSKEKGLLEVDKTKGTSRQFSIGEIKFEGKENPGIIEVRETGISLISDQNVALLDNSGKMVFHTYKPAPKEPGLKRALLFARAIRMAYIGTTSKITAGAYGAVSQSTDNQVASEVTGVISDAYNELGSAGYSYAGEAWRMAMARFKASANTPDFVFMMTETNKREYGLLKVNKDNGEIDATIDMGKDKEPSYEVDNITNKVFYLNGSSEIVCYEF
jgi:hypothetical protein